MAMNSKYQQANYYLVLKIHHRNKVFVLRYDN